jgi:hypothetical protein
MCKPENIAKEWCEVPTGCHTFRPQNNPLGAGDHQGIGCKLTTLSIHADSVLDMDYCGHTTQKNLLENTTSGGSGGENLGSTYFHEERGRASTEPANKTTKTQTGCHIAAVLGNNI